MVPQKQQLFRTNSHNPKKKHQVSNGGSHVAFGFQDSKGN